MTLSRLWKTAAALALGLALFTPTVTFAQGVIHVTGDKVGIITDNPTELLHIQDSADVQVKVEKTGLGSDVLFELVNNGTPRFVFRDTNSGFNWLFEASGSGFFINDLTDAGAPEFIVRRNGNVEISGSVTTNGPSCTSGCDRVFAPEFERPSIEDHASYMWQNRHLPAVGPTSPSQPLNLTERSAALLNELELAHIYIEQLAGELEERNAEIASLRDELDQMEQSDADLADRLARLEALASNGQ